MPGWRVLSLGRGNVTGDFLKNLVQVSPGYVALKSRVLEAVACLCRFGGRTESGYVLVPFSVFYGTVTVKLGVIRKLSTGKLSAESQEFHTFSTFCNPHRSGI